MLAGSGSGAGTPRAFRSGGSKAFSNLSLLESRVGVIWAEKFCSQLHHSTPPAFANYAIVSIRAPAPAILKEADCRSVEAWKPPGPEIYPLWRRRDVARVLARRGAYGDNLARHGQQRGRQCGTATWEGSQQEGSQGRPHRILD